jgi:anti-sigma factor RsiW
MRHLTTAWLVGFAEGRLSPRRTKYVERHIEICARCFAEASEWRSLLGVMKTPVEDAPTSAVRSCLAIYERATPLPDRHQFSTTVVFRGAAISGAGVRIGWNTTEFQEPRNLLLNTAGEW